MSFTCEFCGKAQPQGTKPIRRTTIERQIYEVVLIDDMTADLRLIGTEIVKEKKSCLACSVITMIKKVVKVVRDRKPNNCPVSAGHGF